ncbi:MAG: hypothetical protein ACO2OS_02225 [Thermosphaera aggregans]|uniref:hypothetical protein n=1 Tax=Thermosphaera aggregans TaxID=54254 RepID=UPI003BFCA7ED
MLEPFSTVAGRCVAYLGKPRHVDRVVRSSEDLREHPRGLLNGFAERVFSDATARFPRGILRHAVLRSGEGPLGFRERVIKAMFQLIWNG